MTQPPEPTFLRPRRGCRATLLQTTRLGGASRGAYAGFNLAGHVGEDPATTAANWRALGAATGWRRDVVATARQVHGDRVVTVRRGGHHAVDADALVSVTAGIGVGVYTADCVPVLLAAVAADGQVRGVGAAHCGWRGAAAGLAGRTARHLAAASGVGPERMVAWLAASVAQCSYEVGPEVASRFARAHARPGGGDRSLLDVGGAVVADLVAAGVPASRIERSARDTYAEPGRLYSYRRDGARSGRMLSLAGWGR